MHYISAKIAIFCLAVFPFSTSFAAFAASSGIGIKREQILSGAQKEGKLRVLSSLDPASFNAHRDAFMKKYPFIKDVRVEEMKGTAGPQKFLMELSAGRGDNWDVFDVAPEFYDDFQTFIKAYDFLAMVRDGVVKIPPQIIDPKTKNIVAIASSIHGIAYNPKIVQPEKVPNRWEDFYKPEFKGRKFMQDIRPQGFAAMAAGLGLEWAVQHARKLRQQGPVWVRGQSRAITAMSNGESGMLHLAYYHSCIRAKEKNVTKTIECKVIEPVPARIQEMTAVNTRAQNPNAGLLWVEFQVSPQGQRIIDDKEPLKSSIFVPGSELATVTQGKKLSLNDWGTFHKTEEYMKKAIEAFGFPQAELK
ncbi:MAG: ABC transporter substrate-binding protein [Candidatus Binatia bacterium]